MEVDDRQLDGEDHPRAEIADSGAPRGEGVEIGTAGGGAIGGGDGGDQQQPDSQQSLTYNNANDMESTSTEVDYLVGVGSGNLVDILA